MSGITTTGSTIFSGLDTASPGLLIWRSMLQWLGGIGFIGMAVAILPLLRVGGMRLFQTESSDWSDKVTPRSHVAAKYILSIYLGLTALSTAALWLAGMTPFEAINHAMTLISTGGFSTSDASLAHWTQPAIHWVAVVIMIFGGMPFALYVSTLRGNRRALIKDHQVQGFIAFLVFVWLAAGTWLSLNSDFTWLDAVRTVAVNVTSVVTTTGVALGDYTLWGSFAVLLFFYLTFVGGCSGSTSGGLKIFRFQVANALLMGSLKQLIHPRAVTQKKYNNHPIDEEIARSLLTFSFFRGDHWRHCIGVGADRPGLDHSTVRCGHSSMQRGPWTGDIIGPAGNFSTLPDSAKWLLTIGMLLGRLEILTVLVLFTPVFWKY